jgi:hypothetical protein
MFDLTYFTIEFTIEYDLGLAYIHDLFLFASNSGPIYTKYRIIYN